MFCSQNKLSKCCSANNISESLAESAAAYTKATARKCLLAKVEVITGEEAESNVLQVRNVCRGLWACEHPGNVSTPFPTSQPPSPSLMCSQMLQCRFGMFTVGSLRSSFFISSFQMNFSIWTILANLKHTFCMSDQLVTIALYKNTSVLPDQDIICNSSKVGAGQEGSCGSLHPIWTSFLLFDFECSVH